MPAMIVEDRILARVAFQAVGGSEPAGPQYDEELAIRRALKALRALGAVITPWTVRALQDDVAIIYADAARTTQARAAATRVTSGAGGQAPKPAREAA